MDIKELLDIVTLKKIDDNRFEGKNYETVWGRVFGGQVLSQSLHAAYQTVPDDSCLLYTSPSPRDISGSRMPSSA